jgi:LysR family glycine cleavage system transcriptional activator
LQQLILLDQKLWIMTFANLPPLKALRYFEAAARKKSFTLASDELNITQSAVSQQIRNLEAFVGAALFKRGTSTIELTDVGRDYFATVTKAFERIDGATAKAKKLRTRRKKPSKFASACRHRSRICGS